MLSMWRRHLKRCQHASKGRIWTKCSCPVWCDGEVNNKRVRKSLETRDWARAGRKLAALEDELARPATAQEAAKSTTVQAACAAFLSQSTVEPSTMRKYRRIMDRLETFANDRGIAAVGGFSLERLDAYRSTRELCPLSWQKELQFLRTFFEFCRDREWIEKNPARAMKMPLDPKPKPRAPYTQAEIIRILAATESFGKGSYERLRARAMVLLLRFYGLRVSDVATLRRERIKGDHVFLHAVKNGAAIWLPLYRDVKEAIERLPLPRGADQDCEYLFWTGKGARDGHIKTVDQTLKSVFATSGVDSACAHRFRHTLATEILISGGTIEDAANILGDSPEIIRKHYAKWSVEYQRRTVDIMSRIHGTSTAHKELSVPSASKEMGYLVPEVGVEPTCSVKSAGF